MAQASEKGPVTAPRTRTSALRFLQAGSRLDEERHAAVASRVGPAQPAQLARSAKDGSYDRGHVRRTVEVADAAAERFRFDVVDVDADGQRVRAVDLVFPLQGLEEQVEAAANLRGRAADEPRLVLVDRGDEGDPVDGLERPGPFYPFAPGHRFQMKTLPRV